MTKVGDIVRDAIGCTFWFFVGPIVLAAIKRDRPSSDREPVSRIRFATARFG